MKNNNKTIFHSFEEVAKYLGIKTNKQNPKNKEEQIVRFKKYHLCPTCHVPMTYCGGNIMVCQNENCKGVPHKYVDDETGAERIWYSNSYQILDEKGEQIANRLLSD